MPVKNILIDIDVIISQQLEYFFFINFKSYHACYKVYEEESPFLHCNHCYWSDVVFPIEQCNQCRHVVPSFWRKRERERESEGRGKGGRREGKRGGRKKASEGSFYSCSYYPTNTFALSNPLSNGPYPDRSPQVCGHRHSSSQCPEWQSFIQVTTLKPNVFVDSEKLVTHFDALCLWRSHFHVTLVLQTIQWLPSSLSQKFKTYRSP